MFETTSDIDFQIKKKHEFICSRYSHITHFRLGKGQYLFDTRMIELPPLACFNSYSSHSYQVY